MKKSIYILFLAFISIFFIGNSCNKSEGKSMIVIMLGPPGAGKGTQAIDLSKKLKLPHISTGDLFRENIQKNTNLGQKAQSYMNQGLLVPDEIVLDMLFDRVAKEDCKKGYILDGFPRTVDQAKALETHIQNNKLVVINLEVPDGKIIERITGRMTCPKCGEIYHKTYKPPKEDSMCDNCKIPLTQRKDDTEEVAKQRLSTYHQQTEPLIEYYKNQKDVLYTINGISSKEQIQQDILTSIEKSK